MIEAFPLPSPSAVTMTRPTRITELCKATQVGCDALPACSRVADCKEGLHAAQGAATPLPPGCRYPSVHYKNDLSAIATAPVSACATLTTCCGVVAGSLVPGSGQQEANILAHSAFWSVRSSMLGQARGACKVTVDLDALYSKVRSAPRGSPTSSLPCSPLFRLLS